MTLNRPRSRSQNFRIRYLEYHQRYNVRHSGGQIAYSFQYVMDCCGFLVQQIHKKLKQVKFELKALIKVPKTDE